MILDLTPEILRDLYWEQGQSAPQIARKYNVTKACIYSYMQSSEIPRRKTTQVNRNRGKLKDPEILKKMYCDQRLSQHKIGNILNVSPSAVMRAMQIYGIPGRPTGGRNGANWKSGKTLSTNGYVMIKLFEGEPLFEMAQKEGYVPEHRFVMAKHLNRPLYDWEIVHHINRIKTDNRIENLQLLPPDEHSLKTFACQNCSVYKRLIILDKENRELRGLTS